MKDFLTRLDGTGREPFPSQVEFLRWLQDGWDKARVHAAQLPPGVGKSFIARAIQLATGAAVITPSNMLVDQYSGTYSDVNVLKGGAHYQCEKGGVSCAVMKEMGNPPCTGCPYRQARAEALSGEPTFYNPMSMYYLAGDDRFERPAVTVVDEAHTLLSMLLLVSGYRFSSLKFRLPDSTNAIDVLEWLREQRTKIERVYRYHTDKKEIGKAAQALADMVRMETVSEHLEEDASNYVIYFSTDKYKGRPSTLLNVIPIDPPRSLIERVLGTGKVVLLSATLSRLDAQALALGDPFEYLDMRSPIPAAQRPIYYRPIPGRAGSETSPEAIADWIKSILAENEGDNAIVHVTYGMSKKLAQYFPEAVRNTSVDDKDEAIARFKRDGGLFIAAGCSEGLDLPDDECRVNMIPVLPMLNPYDPAVKKWLARPGGQRRYNLKTLETLQQQVGRSTRHIRDYSKTYIGDSRFSELVLKNGSDVSISFTESIEWRRGKVRGKA